MEMNDSYPRHPMAVPDINSETEVENLSLPMSEKLSPNRTDAINLMTAQSIVPESEARKIINILRDNESGSEKNFFFRDTNNHLLYTSKLIQGSYSKSSKCSVHTISEDDDNQQPMTFDAQSKVCCNGKWKIGELRNETGAVVGHLEMRIPTHTNGWYITEVGLAVSINDNNGQAMFKIKMISGPQPSRKRKGRRGRRTHHSDLENQQPYIFNVLSAAYGRRSVGLISVINATYNCCSLTTPRAYTFEYNLPLDLDSPTMSMILSGVMALETSFTDQERNSKYALIVVGLIFLSFIAMQILLVTVIMKR